MKAGRRFATLIVLALALAMPWLLSQSWLNTLIIAVLYAYLASAWNIVGGFAGQFSLAHGLFFACGAYGSTLLEQQEGVNPWLGMLISAAFAAALGAAIAWISFRRSLPPLTFALVTLALGMLGLLGVSSSDAFGGAGGISLPIGGGGLAEYRMPSDQATYYIILAHLLVVLAICVWIYEGRLGLYFRALRDSERGARAIGIDVLGYKMLAMAISAALTAAGGTFMARYLLFIDPPTFLGLDVVVQSILFAVVGGIGTIFGPLLGALILVPLSEALRAQLGSSFSGLYLVVYGAVLVLVIRLAPGGLVGIVYRMRARGSPGRA